MNDEQVDRLFATLAHSLRRRMLDLIQAAPGMTVTALGTHFDVSRIAVLKHLRVLENADLVLSRKQGRSRHLFFNPVPIQQIHDRWTTQYSAFWSERMVDIQARVEGDAADLKDKRSA